MGFWVLRFRVQGSQGLGYRDIFLVHGMSKTAEPTGRAPGKDRQWRLDKLGKLSELPSPRGPHALYQYGITSGKTILIAAWGLNSTVVVPSWFLRFASPGMTVGLRWLVPSLSTNPSSPIVDVLHSLKDPKLLLLRTLSYGNYGILLMMGNAGFISSAVFY